MLLFLRSALCLLRARIQCCLAVCCSRARHQVRAHVHHTSHIRFHLSSTIHSFIHSFIHTFIHSFIHSLIHHSSFIHPINLVPSHTHFCVPSSSLRIHHACMSSSPRLRVSSSPRLLISSSPHLLISAGPHRGGNSARRRAIISG